MKTLRVLEIVTTRFAANGISQYVITHIDGLGEDIVCDVVAVNEPEEDLARRVTERGGNLFILPMRNTAPWKYYRRLIRLIKRGDYDIVHAHGNSRTLTVELLAAKAAGVPVRIPHAHNTHCTQKALHTLLKPLFQGAYTDAAACGRAAGRFLYPNRSFTVLRNGIDTARFCFSSTERDRLRDELDAHGRCVLLHVGSFNEQKNQNFLIEPFARVYERDPRYLLLLVGDGERLSAVRAQADRLGLGDAVRFLGRRDDVPSLLSAADVFLMPSLYEGFPISLIEAQCAGLPCLVSDRVTQDAAVMKTVRFLPLEEETWKRAMLESERLGYDREAAREVIVGAGYDRGQTSAELAEFYRKAAGERD